MQLNRNRILLSQSTLYQAVTKDGVKASLGFISEEATIDNANWKDYIIKLKDLNYPMMKFISKAVEDNKIIFSIDPDKNNSIIFIPAVEKNTSNVKVVYVNIARFAKVTSEVDMITGKLKKKVQIAGGYECFYALLYSAFAYLNINKVMKSFSIETYARETYVDIFAEVLSRHVSNPVDGEKLRFFLSWFFYGGTKSAIELASALHFNENIARNLQTVYNMEKTDYPPTLEWLINSLCEEFPPYKAKGLDIAGLVASSIKGLGSTGIFLMDNTGYMIACFCSRILFPTTFPGYMLNKVEKKGGKGFIADVNKAIISE